MKKEKSEETKNNFIPQRQAFINTLRYAFELERILEQQILSGTHYTETIEERYLKWNKK